MKLSGAKAAGKHSSREAIGFYKEALNCLDQLPETEENKKQKLEVIHLTAFPMLHLGYPQDFLPILEEGVKISMDLGDNRSLANLNGRIGSYHAFRGNPLVGITYAEKAIEKAQEVQDIELLAPLAFEVVAPYLSTGKFFEIVDFTRMVLDLIEKAKREADSFGKPMNVYSVLCARCGGFLSYMGDFEEGNVFLEKGLRNATEINDSRALAVVKLYCGIRCWAKGEWELSKGHFYDCIRYSEETKWPMLLAMAWAQLGRVFCSLGDPQTAINHIEKALKIQTDAGIKWWMSVHYVCLGQARLALSDIKDALRFTQRSLKLSQDDDEKLSEAFAWIWLGKVLEKTEPPQIDRAEESILKGIKISTELKLKANYSVGYLFLGELHLNKGARDKAIKNLKKADKMFRETGMDYWQDRTQKILGRL